MVAGGSDGNPLLQLDVEGFAHGVDKQNDSIWKHLTPVMCLSVETIMRLMLIMLMSHYGTLLSP